MLMQHAEQFVKGDVVVFEQGGREDFIRFSCVFQASFNQQSLDILKQSILNETEGLVFPLLCSQLRIALVQSCASKDTACWRSFNGGLIVSFESEILFSEICCKGSVSSAQAIIDDTYAFSEDFLRFSSTSKNAIRPESSYKSLTNDSFCQMRY